jgi:hypothetical protein
LAELEKTMKQHEKEEARKVLQGMKNRTAEMVAYEKELDRLIDEERLKKERKEDEDWRNKEKARIGLLHQVYNDRERKVKQHQSEREEDKRQKEVDKQEVERRLKEYEADKERRMKEEYEQGKV